MPEALIGIGSNDDPEPALHEACAALARRFGPLRRSSVYKSAAFGAAAPDYLNMVVVLCTEEGPAALRRELAAIETAVGRTRVDPTVCRLDLDLLFYGCRVDAEQRLPRDGAFTLPFVLAPLVEVRPELPHPLTGVPSGAAWRALAADVIVEKLRAGSSPA